MSREDPADVLQFSITNQPHNPISNVFLLQCAMPNPLYLSIYGTFCSLPEWHLSIEILRLLQSVPHQGFCEYVEM